MAEERSREIHEQDSSYEDEDIMEGYEDEEEDAEEAEAAGKVFKGRLRTWKLVCRNGQWDGERREIGFSN